MFGSSVSEIRKWMWIPVHIPMVYGMQIFRCKYICDLQFDASTELVSRYLNKDIMCWFVIVLWGENDFLKATLYCATVWIRPKLYSVTTQHNHWPNIVTMWCLYKVRKNIWHFQNVGSKKKIFFSFTLILLARNTYHWAIKCVLDSWLLHLVMSFYFVWNFCLSNENMTREGSPVDFCHFFYFQVDHFNFKMSLFSLCIVPYNNLSKPICNVSIYIVVYIHRV